MHRTVKGQYLLNRSAEVNGTKPKSLRTGQEKPHRQQKSRVRNTYLTRLLKSFIWVFCNDFAAVDFREELCYHSRPKKQIQRATLESVFRNNRARKRIRTLIFHQDSYAHRLAQKTRLSAGCALDGFVGGKGVCPFPASHFAAFSRELVFNPRFRAARLLRKRKKRSTKVLPCAGAEDEIICGLRP